MSKFKDFPQFIVELGSSILDWKNELKAHLTRNGFQIVGENDTQGNVFIDFIPTAGQPIGNEFGHEVCRVAFDATRTVFSTYMVGTATVGGQLSMAFTMYGSDNNITIDGKSIYVAGFDYYTPPYDRTKALYAALLAEQQANPGGELAGLTFTLYDNPAGDHNQPDAARVIMSVTNGRAAPVLSQGMRFTSYVVRNAYQAGAPALTFSESYTLSHDLASGFVYYLSIHERKVELATKTIANFYGPVGVQWTPHAAAVAATPPGLVPIEALVYYSGANLEAKAEARASHVWGITFNANYGLGDISSDVLTGEGFVPSRPLRNIRPSPVGNGAGRYRALGGGFNLDAGYGINTILGNGVNVVSLATMPVVDQGAYQTIAHSQPGLALDDVYAFTQAATNESLHLARVVSDGKPLANAIDGSITVSDGALFAPAGSVIVGSEIVKYTGKAGNTLTGLTRGSYGTTQAEHAVGEVVYPGMWFVKINGGAMSAGYLKPGEVA